MKQRLWWLVAGLTAVLVLVLFGVGLWRARAERKPTFEPLRVEQRQVGTLPPPPPAVGSQIDYWAYTNAALADFNGDSVPEVLAQGEVLQGSYLVPAYAGWLDLKSGARATTLLLPLLPSIPQTSSGPMTGVRTASDALPLAREVIAWDPKVGELLLLRRPATWQTQPIATLAGERLHRALATDIDHDGRLDDYLLRLQSGKFAYFTLDARQRVQQASLPLSQAEADKLLQEVYARAYPFGTVGVLPPPSTFSATKQALRDLDGDGKHELVKEGDVFRGKPAYLHLSRMQQRVPLPIHGFSLSQQVQVAEIDGRIPKELITIRKAGSLLLQAYRVQGNALRLVAELRAPLRSNLWSTQWLRDLDGDGKAEVVIADIPERGARTIRWRVFRFDESTWREVATHEMRMPTFVKRLFQAADVPNALVFAVSYQPPFAFLTGGGGDTTVIVLPPKGVVALEPRHWRVHLMEDVFPKWVGDYNNDGVEEVVLSGPFRQSYLLRVWNGVLFGTKLSDQAVSVVLPTAIDGEPSLVVVYEKGAVEVIQAISARGQ